MADIINGGVSIPTCDYRVVSDGTNCSDPGDKNVKLERFLMNRALKTAVFAWQLR